MERCLIVTQTTSSCVYCFRFLIFKKFQLYPGNIKGFLVKKICTINVNTTTGYRPFLMDSKSTKLSPVMSLACDSFHKYIIVTEEKLSSC